jgi:hypothetical protein
MGALGRDAPDTQSEARDASAGHNGRPPMHEPEGDLLWGVAAIAEHLGVTVGAARVICRRPDFPSWRLGKMRCATRSGSTRWMREREREALAANIEAEAK